MGNFDWEIWFKKLAKKVVFGAAVGGLTETAAYLGSEPIPTQYVWLTIVLIEGIELVLNAIKHSWIAK